MYYFNSVLRACLVCCVQLEIAVPRPRTAGGLGYTRECHQRDYYMCSVQYYYRYLSHGTGLLKLSVVPLTRSCSTVYKASKTVASSIS